jgi:hypothetical protein
MRLKTLIRENCANINNGYGVDKNPPPILSSSLCPLALSIHPVALALPFMLHTAQPSPALHARPPDSPPAPSVCLASACAARSPLPILDLSVIIFSTQLVTALQSLQSLQFLSGTFNSIYYIIR